MANSPAKNISSLDSHTIVPTLTRFGRVSECTRLLSNARGCAVGLRRRSLPHYCPTPDRDREPGRTRCGATGAGRDRLAPATAGVLLGSVP